MKKLAKSNLIALFTDSIIYKSHNVQKIMHDADVFYSIVHYILIITLNCKVHILDILN